ncbi:hypothetical protein L6164_023631 [Bauhinia variegata]|uniref:Uncharacterized protein n=1 Tax=Bauhinia variegata TaxID=167791 RepID=A0ACB9MNX1_BAUVA|nr:hypothetical protein L6164_023631 [Bauhinia variegata]
MAFTVDASSSSCPSDSTPQWDYQIVECEKILGHEIIPIFYGVDPSDVRNQRKSFAVAFRKHDERFGADKEKVRRWRVSLREVANISGWDSKDWAEAELIECIVRDLYRKLQRKCLLKLCKMQLPCGLNCLPGALKVLDWIQRPLKSLPLTVELDELVHLKFCHSKLKQLWNGTKFLGCLKFIDMSFSKNLTRVPDISGVPNLESLILEGCKSLFEVHPSLGQHRKLVLVTFEDCRNLKYLPGKLEMSSMEHLILSGCSKVKQLPEFGASILKLSSLSLEETSIKELPLSIGCLIGLVVLKLKDCKNLCCLPSTIQNLKSLSILNISGCSKLSRLPENLQEIKSLTKLIASGTAIEEVTSRMPKNLEVLSF